MKWLQWLLDNPVLVVVIGGVLAQMMKALFGKKGDDAEAPPQEEFEDPELAERTRQIREEIQRKIEQRAKGYPTEPPRAPRPEPEPAAPPIIREVVGGPPSAAKPATRFEAQRQAEILEEQAALMERLRQAELMKAAAQKRTEFEIATEDHTAAKRAATRSSVVDDLRSPETLRRAFILREVLGPPVALRR